MSGSRVHDWEPRSLKKAFLDKLLDLSGRAVDVVGLWERLEQGYSQDPELRAWYRWFRDTVRDTLAIEEYPWGMSFDEISSFLDGWHEAVEKELGGA
jgi:hypothetical protein